MFFCCDTGEFRSFEFAKLAIYMLLEVLVALIIDLLDLGV